jgi:hypothetical protein
MLWYVGHLKNKMEGHWTRMVVWNKMVPENDGDKYSTKTSQADTQVAYGAIAIARVLDDCHITYHIYNL